ncbi:hypothetical protein [Kitasatospora purpeofusca]|uniref:hypothetical protein n=1 Tax=Kitasatospora purpeofusca TaxID=67352 RepID=UPI0037F58979
MRGIVVRTLVAVVLGTGAWWGGSASALATDSGSGSGPAVTAAPGSAHHGATDGKPAHDAEPGGTGKLGDLGDLLDLDGRGGNGGNGGGHSDRQCTVTTAWGDSWCPRKPLD